MKFSVQRQELITPLQVVAGATERRNQTLPILSNLLLDVKSHQLSMTGTDTEVELIARVTLSEPAEVGEITVPARKLMDICRALPEDAVIDFSLDKDHLLIRSGRSRFVLSTLSASEFPSFNDGPGSVEFSIDQKKLQTLISKTHFAMAQQDVRYYLNGLLLEIDQGTLRAVATDGHRMAMSSVETSIDVEKIQVVLPRKGVLELMRLLHGEEDLAVTVGANYVRIMSSGFTFTSKLIDGRFPDYDRVIPRGGQRSFLVDRDVLKQLFTRVSVLCNEKYKGVRLQLRDNLLRVVANNPEQEI